MQCSGWRWRLTSSKSGVGCFVDTAAARCSIGKGLRRSCHENARRMQYAAVRGPVRRVACVGQLLAANFARGSATLKITLGSRMKLLITLQFEVGSQQRKDHKQGEGEHCRTAGVWRQEAQAGLDTWHSPTTAAGSTTWRCSGPPSSTVTSGMASSGASARPSLPSPMGSIAAAPGPMTSSVPFSAKCKHAVVRHDIFTVVPVG